jgi:hypothetical protein
MTAQLVKIPNYVTYLCFSPDTSDEDARKGFIKRYKREPQEVVRDHNMVWTGPIKVKP